MNLERETRVELATPAALRAVLCLGSIGLTLIVNPLDSESAGDLPGCCSKYEGQGWFLAALIVNQLDSKPLPPVRSSFYSPLLA